MKYQIIAHRADGTEDVVDVVKGLKRAWSLIEKLSEVFPTTFYEPRRCR